jgi:valyl-tRNA synthetase
MPGLASRIRYEPGEVEPRVLERWLQSGIFHPEAEPPPAPGEAYSIAIPPPNVT